MVDFTILRHGLNAQGDANCSDSMNLYTGLPGRIRHPEMVVIVILSAGGTPALAATTSQ
jgi:hypothetical protein